MLIIIADIFIIVGSVAAAFREKNIIVTIVSYMLPLKPFVANRSRDNVAD